MQSAEERSYCTQCNAVFRTPFSRCPLDGSKLSDLTTDPLVGTVIDNRYEVVECIGEGGMGRVYRAKHTRMSRYYAVKVLFGDHAGDTRMRSRFAREAEAVSRISHTNVISVVDFGETKSGLLYLVMDLAEGESLAHLVHREAPLEPQRALRILAQLAKGLGHAHGQGLVHRDFKCENVIMVNQEDVEVPKIVDFGICMIIEDAPSSSMLTSHGMIMGTPAVMAPEQASGDLVDHRTDLFSLGIVGYQMLSGKLPFEGTPLDMARKNLYEPLPAIADRSGVHIDPALEGVIRRLTEKDPDRRYQNARDVLYDLQQIAAPGVAGPDWSAPTPMPQQQLQVHTPAPRDTFSPRATSTPMVTEISRASRPLRSNARLYWAGGLLAVFLGVGGTLALQAGSNDKESDEVEAATTLAQAQTAADSANSVEPAQPLGAIAADTPETDTPSTEPAAAEPPANDEPGHEGEGEGEIDSDSERDGDTPDEAQKQADKESAKARQRRWKNKRGRNNKAGEGNKADPASSQKEALAKTKRLYYSVANNLAKLEKEHGKAAVAALRRDYSSISYTRLVSDPSIQPVYYQSLLRLQTKIRARDK